MSDLDLYNKELYNDFELNQQFNNYDYDLADFSWMNDPTNFEYEVPTF